MDDKALRDTLSLVAKEFGNAAHDTILYENLGKHVFELKLIIDHLQPRAQLLDLGGGMGVNLLTLRKLGYTEATLHLMDQFEEYTDENRMGDSGKALELSRQNKIKIIAQNILQQPQLPFEDSSLSMVTCFDVIEHLPRNPVKVLDEIHRVLMPGGVLLLSGPNAKSLMKRVKLVRGIHPYIPFNLWIQDKYFSHYREYTPEEYAALVKKCDFTDVEVKRVTEPSMTRARKHYHNKTYSAVSFTSVALITIAAIETVFPGLRSAVYCIASKK